ncbi:hypothetical protein CMK12_04570 [Candidatus Poribacteria bacterium]|nr:hypothetical protein [Candidatus Poribacteria bacterium]MDP6597097.1 hypothetical protein [Candidatus Poribacteria bacterium]
MAYDQSLSVIPDKSAEQEKLTRRIGYTGPDANRTFYQGDHYWIEPAGSLYNVLLDLSST